MSFKWKGGMAAAAFLLVSLLAFTPASAGDLMYGDADLSGAVDGGDLALVKLCVSNSAQCPGNSDGTGDDCSIKASDAFALQKHLAFGNVLPIKDPGTPPGCWCVSLAGPTVTPVKVPVGVDTPVTATVVTNVSPPRGGLKCDGIVVDFTAYGGGCIVSAPSAVTDASCEATITVNCSVAGPASLVATINLEDSSGGSRKQVVVDDPVGFVDLNVVLECGISSVSPVTGCPDDDVTIDGSNFGAVEGTVEFDATPANVITWTDTSIVVDAPGGDFSLVTVTPPAQPSCSYADAYSYDNVGPVAPSIDPPSGEYCIGDSITVTPNESGGSLHCTTDSSDPDCASPDPPATITGAMDLRCVQCDDCTNEGQEASESYTVDTVASVSITYPVNGETVTLEDIIITGTADADITSVTVTWSNPPIGPGGSTTVAASGSWSVPVYGLTNGTIIVDAQGDDECLNTGIALQVAAPVELGVCNCPVAGALYVIHSLPREDASFMPPTSVTLNMPTQAYLQIIFNEDLNISSANVSISSATVSAGNLSLYTDTCINDSVLWTATLPYSFGPVTLTISGVKDCDEGNTYADIVLVLRSSRNVTEPPGVQAQTGEGFLDGHLQVWVIDEMTQNPIQDTVVQVNVTTSVGGSGYAEDVAVTGADGKVSFGTGNVDCTVPVMLTAIAPEHQYLTFAHLDARQIVMGLRHSGYGLMQLGDTQIIGDFDPQGYVDGIHEQITRNYDLPNPTRFGMASLGLHKRALNTLVPEDILATNVLMQLTMVLDIGNGASAVLPTPVPGNMVLPDFVTARYDIPSMGSFQQNAFFRLGTRDSGRDVYVELGGGSCNIEDVEIPALLEGSLTLMQLISGSPITFSCGDIQKITVPALSPGGCQLIIIDTVNHGVTQDDCAECNKCSNIVVSNTRRMNINHLNYGWNGNTATDGNPTPAIAEANYSFAQAIRANWSNLIYDPEKNQNWSSRIKTVDHDNNDMPDIIPTLFMPGIETEDETIMAVGIGLCTRIYNGVGSKLIGYPDVTALGNELGIPGPWTMVPNIQHFDWEVRYASHVGVDWGTYPGPGPDYPIFKTSEWIPLTVGTLPADPGARSGNHQVHGISINVEYDQIGPEPQSPANELSDRLFEWWEVTATGGGNFSVIDDGQAGVDPEMNGEIVVSTLIDRCSTDPNYVNGNWGENPVPNGSQNLGVWENTPIESTYKAVWGFDRDGGGGGGYGENKDYPMYKPSANKLWRVITPSNLAAGGKLSFYLPEVPTVFEIESAPLSLPDGSIYTFESLNETGLRDNYIMEWEYAVMNMATNVTMQNFASPYDERQVLTQSQNRQNLIFRR
jgi:hypothetical protein